MLSGVKYFERPAPSIPFDIGTRTLRCPKDQKEKAMSIKDVDSTGAKRGGLFARYDLGGQRRVNTRFAPRRLEDFSPLLPADSRRWDAPAHWLA